MAARLTTYVVVGIVAATLIAGLIVGAQRDDSDGPVDLIVQNGRVYTAGPDADMAEAVAVRGNQILRVGSNREINRLRRPQTTVIDAKGAAVLPGFNDAHLQFIEGGRSLEQIDLLDADSLDELRHRIETWAGGNPDAPWVIGRGWTREAFGTAAPTRQVLDTMVPDRPAQLFSADGHAVWVNSRALHLAGVTRRTVAPAGGVIARDSRSGEPTGLLEGPAIALIQHVVPRATEEDRARALRSAIAEANRHGITSVQNTAGSVDDFGLYAEARRVGDLTVRVYSALAADGAATAARLDELDAASAKYPDDPLFKTGAVRIVIDGPLATGGAAWLEPVAAGGGTELPTIDPDELNRLVRLIDARGLQVMAHASGDRAVRMALNAYEHAARSNAAPARGRRHRIEHVDAVDPADMPRFDALGVIASMQPYRGHPTPAAVAAWTDMLGADRASRLWPYASLARAGARMAFGSNWPAAPMSPLLALHLAVNRTPVGVPDADPWTPRERLALQAAIDAYTSGAAWASFDEQRKGSLAAGMLADLVVLSDDIFEAPSATLANTTVAYTIFDGKIVYQRAASATN